MLKDSLEALKVRYALTMLAAAVATAAAIGGTRFLYEGAGALAGKALVITLIGYVVLFYTADHLLFVRREIKKLSKIADDSPYGKTPEKSGGLWD